jgi:hypothetical protein
VKSQGDMTKQITGKLPVSGVTTITLRNGSGNVFSSATSDAQGNFTISVPDSLVNSFQAALLGCFFPD